MAQKKFIIDGGFQTSDDSSIAANLEMTGHIIPTVDSNGTTGFDLGSTTKKWRDLYLSEGSLYIDGQKVIESDSGTIVVQADANQSLTTQVSGSGVLTLTSATTIAMNGTMQMAAGKKITDVGGNAVTFGDKVDMDSNKIENVGTPTAATDGANKSYVDTAVSDLVNGAPGALDTLNELANALGDDDDFAGSMTTSLATKAATTYVDAADQALAVAYAAADSVSAASINAAWAAADNAQTTSINAAWAAADTAQTTAITSAYQTYADSAESDAVSTAAGDATTKANAAQAAAEATASADATAKANAAQSAAESTAASDATTKADAAQAAAIAAVTNGAGAAFDTLKEIQDAMATDAELSTAITNVTSSAAATAAADATAKANAAQAAAEATAAAANTALDGTLKTYADTAEADARAYTDTRETSINIAWAAADATQTTAITTAYQTYADQAEADAISTASADATAKANSAQATAEAYTDTELANLVGSAPGALDTLNELAAAIGDDANFASTVTTSLATKAATTYVDSQDVAVTNAAATDATTKASAAQSAAISAAATDATTKADQAEADAISTAAADATAKANAAQTAAQATASADATSKDSALSTTITTAYTSAIATAVAGIEAQISTSRFHSGVTDVTNASTLAYTFSDIVGAEDYTVYVNRLVVRPAELSSVNLSTGVVTFASSVIEVDDEIEVCGWKLVS